MSDGLNSIEKPAAAPVPAYSYFVAAVLCVVYTFNFLDRQFLSVLAQPVKVDLHLSDTQLGMLTGLMFALFYTVCGLPVAALADRYSRVRIVAVACFLWSLFSAACGLATNFTTLALARTGVGVGEAGGSAPSYSIISDYFPPEKRGVGLAIFSLGVPFGILLGAASGGWVAVHYGWRAAFLILGGLGLVLAPILPLLVREPLRGRLDAPPASDEPPASLKEAIGVFSRSPTLMLTALGAGLIALVSYGLSSWAPALLIREKGMGLGQIATHYSLVAGVSIGLGTWLGGYVVDKWGPRNPAVYALTPGIAILAALPFLFGVTAAPSWQAALLFLFAPYLLASMYLAPALALIQNGVAARRRSAAGALFLLALNLIGLGVGPLFVGMISDAFHPRFGVHSLGYALNWLAPFFILAALCQFYVAARLHRTRLKT